MAAEKKYFRVLFDYTAASDIEMTIQRGQILQESSFAPLSTSPEWSHVQLGAKTGFVPTDYIKEISADEAHAQGADLAVASTSEADYARQLAIQQAAYTASAEANSQGRTEVAKAAVGAHSALMDIKARNDALIVKLTALSAELKDQEAAWVDRINRAAELVAGRNNA